MENNRGPARGQEKATNRADIRKNCRCWGYLSCSFQLRKSLLKQKWCQVWVQLDRAQVRKQTWWLLRETTGHTSVGEHQKEVPVTSTQGCLYPQLLLEGTSFVSEPCVDHDLWIENDSWLVTTWGRADILTMKGPLSLTCHFFLCFTQGLGKFSNSNELNLIIYHKGLTWLLMLQLGLGNKTISNLPTSLRELCYAYEK